MVGAGDRGGCVARERKRVVYGKDGRARDAASGRFISRRAAARRERAPIKGPKRPKTASGVAGELRRALMGAFGLPEWKADKRRSQRTDGRTAHIDDAMAERLPWAEEDDPTSEKFYDARRYDPEDVDLETLRKKIKALPPHYAFNIRVHNGNRWITIIGMSETQDPGSARLIGDKLPKILAEYEEEPTIAGISVYAVKSDRRVRR